jgi:RimJ/RimL family protein N-acetyltransferase
MKILKYIQILALALVLLPACSLGTNKPIDVAIKAPTEVKGDKVTLKALKEEDFVDYHKMLSDVIRKNLEFSENMTLEETIQFLKPRIEKSIAGTLLIYSIFDNKDNKLIGSIEIRDKNDDSCPGQCGCWLNENYWGGGRFQEALKLIAAIYFKIHPDVKSFTGQVELWNQRSYHSSKKYGFKDAGYYYENGKPKRYILEYTRDQVSR